VVAEEAVVVVVVEEEIAGRLVGVYLLSLARESSVSSPLSTIESSSQHRPGAHEKGVKVAAKIDGAIMF
jgi:hypothetical protein